MGSRVLVLGAGSIGSRHAANLVAAGAEVSVMDPDAARAAAPGTTRLPYDLSPPSLAAFDGVVVASPTVFHAEQLAAVLGADRKVMVEKPLAVDPGDVEALVEACPDQLMVAYNLRLHAPVRRLVSLVHDGAVGPVAWLRLWCGSWLPGWRPGVDYRTTYSARVELGGGVLLDAIHELDLLVWLLGPDLELRGASVARLGDLDIDVEDTVAALVRSASGVIAEVQLDYLSRRYRRGIEVVGRDATVRLDWARGVLELEDADGVRVEPADAPVAQSYVREAEVFLDWLDGRGEPPVDGPTGLASLRLATEIRAAARR